TGLGTIVKGEGLLGLTRGFMYAGAKNLLVSLWQVADKSTTELMVQFYRNILNNQQYSTALRNAKLAMIKKGKYAHPVEWSPFILTGK
ncbi:MAG: CHAT domain-containing protein, partial [Bacteroidetes bacterium]|nr:CHAT domain-containing protein [Bacteroidota bacterium]